MDYWRLRRNAREMLRDVCSVCPRCGGVDCIGSLPGMGAAEGGEGFRENCKSLRMYSPLTLPSGESRGEEKDCDISFGFLGVKTSMPIFNAPMTGMRENLGGCLTEWEYAKYCTRGSKKAETIFFAGDGAEDEKFFAGIWSARDAGVHFVSIIKPRSQHKIMEQIDFARSMGALAVGVDVDSFGLLNMLEKGEPVEKKTWRQMRELIEFSEIPFIVKGVLSVRDALSARDAGAAGVVVSNHGGRIDPKRPSSWRVLPSIRRAFARDDVFLIMGDGGIRTGRDVFVALALGASSVLVGRPVLIGAVGGGGEGVSTILKRMGKNLVIRMLDAGCGRIGDISPEKIIITK